MTCAHSNLRPGTDGLKRVTLCTDCWTIVETPNKSLQPHVAPNDAQTPFTPSCAVKTGSTSIVAAELITLPYPPSVNNMYCNVQHVGRVLTKAAKEWKCSAQEILRLSKVNFGMRSVSLTIHAYRPRRRGDLDNIIKAIQDSLVGVVIQDDEQVDELHVYKHEDKANPRVEIDVQERRG